MVLELKHGDYHTTSHEWIYVCVERIAPEELEQFPLQEKFVTKYLF
jgi:hypothetical protein